MRTQNNLTLITLVLLLAACGAQPNKGDPGAIINSDGTVTPIGATTSIQTSIAAPKTDENGCPALLNTTWTCNSNCAVIDFDKISITTVKNLQLSQMTTLATIGTDTYSVVANQKQTEIGLYGIAQDAGSYTITQDCDQLSINGAIFNSAK